MAARNIRNRTVRLKPLNAVKRAFQPSQVKLRPNRDDSWRKYDPATLAVVFAEMKNATVAVVLMHLLDMRLEAIVKQHCCS